ncbi:hypothetical protein LTR37_001680 [Vermiconidia calcicola]|uniref:Uncharacterized protein n=1 Tax=Vermiconidia calcicola TaxID=1690605 RepID=A0ACC3NUW6_9PEZI|nr:hypothetical protein LTR37_001680 [Vermiconidia calcicola]
MSSSQNMQKQSIKAESSKGQSSTAPAGKKPAGDTAQDGQQSSTDPSARECITCMGIGHEYWQCGNTCVYCGRRAHVNRPCPRASSVYPSIPAPQPGQQDAALRNIKLIADQEDHKAHESATQLALLRQLVELTDQGILKAPAPAADESMEVDNVEASASSESKPLVPPSPTLQLLGFAKWDDAFPEHFGAGRLKATVRQLKLDMNHQVKGTCAWNEVETPLRAKLESMGKWPPPGWDEEKGRVVPVSDDADMR